MLRKRSTTKKAESGWNLKTILLESFLILLAVLLALMLNEWNNDRNDRKLVDQILESARQEITENLRLVDASIAHRDVLLTELRSGQRMIQRIPNFTEMSGVDFYDRDALNDFLADMLIREGVYTFLDSEIRKTEDGYLLPYQGTALKLVLEDNDLVVYGAGNIQLMPAFVTSVAWNTAIASNALINMDYQYLSMLSDIYSTQQNYFEIRHLALTQLYSGQGQSIISAIEDMYWLERELQKKYKAFLEL